MSAPTPARRAAYEVLRRVFEHGAWADRALRSAVDRHKLDDRDRAQAQQLAYGSVQRRGTTDHLVAALANRRIEKIDPPLLAALRLGAFELLYAGAAAEHAAVDQAVELAKGGRDGGRRHRGAGLVNAVLRRLVREGRPMLDALDPQDPEDASILHSMPLWITELFFAERGAETALILMDAANQAPHRSYRIADPAGEAPAGLEGAEPLTGTPPGVTLIETPPGAGDAVEHAVAAGALVPQSPGSALAAAAVEAEPGQRLLDLCAAPGIKTTQLAAAVGPSGSVTAIERDAHRASELRALCERVGVGNVEVVVGDGTEVDIGAGYDRLLVDAPCTGLGTLASRPDARWRRKPGDIGELAALQARLLDRGLDALRPGGRAVYSVCTVSRAEADAVLEGTLSSRGDLELLDLTPLAPQAAEPATAGALQTLPGIDGAGEGFFIAALSKSGGEE